MEKSEAGVGDEAAGFEATQLCLVRECGDGGVAGRSAHQIDVFQLLAEFEVRDTHVGDAGLPSHLKAAQIGQVAERLKPGIGELVGEMSAQDEVLQLRHPREVLKAGVGELAGAAEIETCYK